MSSQCSLTLFVLQIFSRQFGIDSFGLRDRNSIRLRVKDFFSSLPRPDQLWGPHSLP